MKICSIEGCNNEYVARGMCSKHYRKASRRGEINVKRHDKQKFKICKIDGCDKKITAREMCCMHYQRLQRLGKMEPLRAPNPIDKTEWTDINIAWLAGIIEGEGNFYLRELGNYFSIKIKVRMTDLDVLEKCFKITKIGNINGPYKNKKNLTYKDIWGWEVTKKTDSLELIKVIYPHLLSRRKAKIDEYLKQISIKENEINLREKSQILNNKEIYDS